MRENQDIQKITDILEHSGWKKLPYSEQMKQVGLDGVYMCEYAAVGFCLTANIAEVIDCWANCQAYISGLRDKENISYQKDLYLIFIILQFH